MLEMVTRLVGIIAVLSFCIFYTAYGKKENVNNLKDRFFLYSYINRLFNKSICRRNDDIKLNVSDSLTRSTSNERNSSYLDPTYNKIKISRFDKLLKVIKSRKKSDRTKPNSTLQVMAAIEHLNDIITKRKHKSVTESITTTTQQDKIIELVKILFDILNPETSTTKYSEKENSLLKDNSSTVVAETMTESSNFVSEQNPTYAPTSDASCTNEFNANYFQTMTHLNVSNVNKWSTVLSNLTKTTDNYKSIENGVNNYTTEITFTSNTLLSNMIQVKENETDQSNYLITPIENFLPTSSSINITNSLFSLENPYEEVTSVENMNTFENRKLNATTVAVRDHNTERNEKFLKHQPYTIPVNASSIFVNIYPTDISTGPTTELDNLNGSTSNYFSTNLNTPKAVENSLNFVTNNNLNLSKDVLETVSLNSTSSYFTSSCITLNNVIKDFTFSSHNTTFNNSDTNFVKTNQIHFITTTNPISQSIMTTDSLRIVSNTEKPVNYKDSNFYPSTTESDPLYTATLKIGKWDLKLPLAFTSGAISKLHSEDFSDEYVSMNSSKYFYSNKPTNYWLDIYPTSTCNIEDKKSYSVILSKMNDYEQNSKENKVSEIPSLEQNDNITHITPLTYISTSETVSVNSSKSNVNQILSKVFSTIPTLSTDDASTIIPSMKIYFQKPKIIKPTTVEPIKMTDVINGQYRTVSVDKPLCINQYKNDLTTKHMNFTKITSSTIKRDRETSDQVTKNISEAINITSTTPNISLKVEIEVSTSRNSSLNKFYQKESTEDHVTAEMSAINVSDSGTAEFKKNTNTNSTTKSIPLFTILNPTSNFYNVTTFQSKSINSSPTDPSTLKNDNKTTQGITEMSSVTNFKYTTFKENNLVSNNTKKFPSKTPSTPLSELDKRNYGVSSFDGSIIENRPVEKVEVASDFLQKYNCLLKNIMNVSSSNLTDTFFKTENKFKLPEGLSDILCLMNSSKNKTEPIIKSATKLEDYRESNLISTEKSVCIQYKSNPFELKLKSNLSILNPILLQQGSPLLTVSPDDIKVKVIVYSSKKVLNSSDKTNSSESKIKFFQPSLITSADIETFTYNNDDVKKDEITDKFFEVEIPLSQEIPKIENTSSISSIIDSSDGWLSKKKLPFYIHSQENNLLNSSSNKAPSEDIRKNSGIDQNSLKFTPSTDILTRYRIFVPQPHSEKSTINNIIHDDQNLEFISSTESNNFTTTLEEPAITLNFYTDQMSTFENKYLAQSLNLNSNSSNPNIRSCNNTNIEHTKHSDNTYDLSDPGKLITTKFKFIISTTGSNMIHNESPTLADFYTKVAPKIMVKKMYSDELLSKINNNFKNSGKAILENLKISNKDKQNVEDEILFDDIIKLIINFIENDKTTNKTFNLKKNKKNENSNNRTLYSMNNILKYLKSNIEETFNPENKQTFDKSTQRIEMIESFFTEKNNQEANTRSTNVLVNFTQQPVIYLKTKKGLKYLSTTSLIDLEINSMNNKLTRLTAGYNRDKYRTTIKEYKCMNRNVNQDYSTEMTITDMPNMELLCNKDNLYPMLNSYGLQEYNESIPVEDYIADISKKASVIVNRNIKNHWNHETNKSHATYKVAMVSTLELIHFQRTQNQFLDTLKDVQINDPMLEREIKLLYLPGMSILPDIKIAVFEEMLYAMDSIFSAASVKCWSNPSLRYHLPG